MKYVKTNFFSARVLHSLQEVTSGIISWCHRANNRLHRTTLKIPAEVLELEAPHLLPLRHSLFQDDPYTGMDRRWTAENAVIEFSSSQYSVPYTYAMKHVFILEVNGLLYIHDEKDRHLLCTHAVNPIKGSLNILPEHRRPKNTAWKSVRTEILSRFPSPSMDHFLNGVAIENPRYRIEQLSAVQRST